MKQVTLSALLAVGLGVCSGALAHHSFAMFDMTQTITLNATVKEFQWTNPHCWVQLIATKDGATQDWSIETMSAGGLKALGWRSDSIKAGDKVVAKIHPLRNGQKGGDLIELTTPAGDVLRGLPATDPNELAKGVPPKP
jgi:Family of unknown function (DUF6152)